MQITLEEISSVKKKLQIEIPQSDVNREFKKSYNEIKKTANIKGFRKGKIPIQIIKQMFGKSVNDSVKSNLLQEAYSKALRDKDLSPIGEPDLNIPELKEGEPFKFDVTIEVKPEIGHIDFKNLSLKKNKYIVGDNELEIQLKAIQSQLASSIPIEEKRTTQNDDIAVIDYEAFVDGKPYEQIPKGSNASFKIGDKRIIPEFDENITGLTVGENKEFSISFPKDYIDKNLAEKNILFKVSLKEIRQEVLPEINDELAKKVGNYENLIQLKNAIKMELELAYENRSNQELTEQIYTLLLDKKEFEIPDVWYQYELNNIIWEVEQSLALKNMTIKDAGYTMESLVQEYKETAEKQARRHLLLDKIIEQEKIKLLSEELEMGYKQMSEVMKRPLENIKEYYSQEENKDKLDIFKYSLLEKKAINMIIEANKIEEVNLST